MANTIIVEISAGDDNNANCYSVEDLYKLEDESDDDFVDGDEVRESREKLYSCKQCVRSFSRKGDLVRHHRIHTDEKPFRCPECGDKFRRKDDMVRHMRTHTDVKPFPCLFCQKNFRRKCDLDKHHFIHKEKELYCSTCNIIFMEKDMFLKHMQMHPTEENFLPCGECGTLFPRRKGMLSYSVEDLYKLVDESDDDFVDGDEVRESREKLYSCKQCVRSFSRKGDLVRHHRIHTDEKPFSCPECGDKFRRKDDMVRHMRTHTDVKPFPCMFCQKNFRRKCDLDKHHFIHKEKDLYCSTCNIIFMEKDRFLKHMQMHPKEENFLPCGECGTLFPRRKGMLRLCKANGGGKRYICVDCRKKRSVKSVSSKKPFGCPECGDSFSRKADMVRHLRLHTGIKPFPCPTCVRRFSRKEDMLRHHLTHSAAKPYNCLSCSKGFTRKSEFESHVAFHNSKRKKRKPLDVDDQN